MISSYLIDLEHSISIIKTSNHFILPKMHDFIPRCQVKDSDLI